MLSADEKNRIFDEIDALLENLSIEDAAAVLTFQVAATIAQGSSSLEEAADFLEEIRGKIAGLLENVDFEAMPEDDEDAAEEPPEPTRN